MGQAMNSNQENSGGYLLNERPRGQQIVGIVGAGTMGAGIAQVAAAAGHPVLLLDARSGAAAEARIRIAAVLDGLVAKGRMAAADSAALIGRITPIEHVRELGDAALVIEVIAEQLQAKQALLRELENHVQPHTILASNTSSISITALANGMAHPKRLVGMHFFNPVPLMKLVEVVSGAETATDVAGLVYATAKAWGKVPVHAKSTPGFIVNRIARPFYAEALALLQEQAGTPAEIDLALRAAGFRMGPCELMDLIGHDINYSVTVSVYDANYGDKRFVPSLVQKALVDGGRLGRKSGKGFYQGEPPPRAAMVAAPLEAPPRLSGTGPLVERLAAHLERAGIDFVRAVDGDWNGIAIGEFELHVTDGRTAGELACQRGNPDLGVIDLPLLAAPDACLALAYCDGAAPAARERVQAALAACRIQPLVLRDVPGLAVARTIAMLVNEGADAVWQGVCDEAGADLAMKLGTNYPAGPFEWLQELGAGYVAGLLDHLFNAYRSERYRVSPLIRQRCWTSRKPS